MKVAYALFLWLLLRPPHLRLLATTTTMLQIFMVPQSTGYSNPPHCTNNSWVPKSTVCKQKLDFQG